MREDRLASTMVFTVTEDTPADMLAGSMELLVQLPRDNCAQTQRVTVQRSTPMMDLLVQIATAHKLTASCYTLQAIGERGLVLPHQPNTPIGALDALQVKLLPKQGTCLPRKTRQINQPFETTFRLQVHLPRNQLYVSRVSPKTNLGDILEEVCREKNLDVNKYELRHPGNLEQVLDLSLTLQDYHLQEVTLYSKQGKSLGSALSSHDIMALQKQEEKRRQQARHSVFGFIFKKSKDSSVSRDSLVGRSTSPTRSDETIRRTPSPVQPPTRPQRKRRPAPKPPTLTSNATTTTTVTTTVKEEMENDSSVSKDKPTVISHSRNSSDSSGYHEASVLSDNADSAGRMLETLPRRSKLTTMSNTLESPRKLARIAQASKSLGNLAVPSGELSHAHSSTSLSSTGQRKKRAAPAPPVAKTLPSAISTQCLLERIVDSEESFTSDMDLSKPSSDIGISFKDNVTSMDHHIAESPKISQAKEESCSETEPRLNQVHTQSDVPLESEVKKVEDTDVTTTAKTDSDEAPVTPAFVTEANVDPAARVVRRDTVNGRTETDILLQKVSDTLSNSVSLETSFPNDSHSKVEETIPCDNTLTEIDYTLKSADETKNAIVENTCSDLSMSLEHQHQDTLDCVSTADWEYYQVIPAPPSGFRDTESPVQEKVLEEMSISQPKETKEVATVKMIEEEKTEVELKPESTKEEIKAEKNVIMELKCESIKEETKAKRDVIVELENKIAIKSTLQTSQKPSIESIGSRKMLDSSLAPRIAPVDNTLSNFTITTYTAPKSFDIFDEVEEEERRLQRSYTRDTIAATLPKKTINSVVQRKSSIEKQDRLPSNETLENERTKEKNVTVYRSKSYITLANVEKYKERKGTEERRVSLHGDDGSSMKKCNSVTNLNQEQQKSYEKFSEWREKMLKKQDDATAERQLRSLQILKSILPQLKNVQPSAGNVTRDLESEETTVQKSIISEQTSSDKSTTSTVSEQKVPLRKTDSTKTSEKYDSNSKSKRYTYTGPPTVSLGSWSERPCVNVQIKSDSDYKFSQSTSRGKTVISLNSTNCENTHEKGEKIDRRTGSLTTNKVVKNDRAEPTEAEKTGSDKLANKFTKHFTTSFNASEYKISGNKSNERHEVNSRDRDNVSTTKVEEKKKNENTSDFDSFNFSERAKIFEQIDKSLHLRTKANSTDRHSVNFSNGCTGQTASPKRTESMHEDYSKKNSMHNGHDQQIKSGGLMLGSSARFAQVPYNKGPKVLKPMVKGFNVASPQVKSLVSIVSIKQEEDSEKEISKKEKTIAPPVITGVTLKNSNVKTKPSEMNLRDQLFESIRNFGGREKLRNAAERH